MPEQTKKPSTTRRTRITEAQVEEQTKKYRRRADKYRNDRAKTEEQLQEAEEKARNNPGPISAQIRGSG